MDKMKERQEEFWFTLFRRGDLRKLWKPQIEIIFMLKGNGQIYFPDGKTAYTVREEDIFVINSFEMQNFELEENAAALSMTVSLRFAAAVNPEILQYQMNCRSFLYDRDRQEPFDVLRSSFAKAFEEQYKNEEQYGFFKSRAAAVLEDLSKYFLDRAKPLENRGGFEALKPAIHYIQAHYRENISLENLEEQTFLSKAYISRSFTRYFGISFTEYVSLLRMEYASRLLRGKETISQIAFESGFPNVNAMIHVFKRHRGMTPGEYRKKTEKEVQERIVKEEDAREDFTVLMKYISNKIQTELPAESIKEITADAGGRKPRISFHWKRIMNAGYARDVINGTVQKEIRYLQEKVGFEYIRVKGFLDDDMCLLKKDMNGKIIVNYTYADEVLDFILSAGARPVIELGYVPGILAENVSFQSMRNDFWCVPDSISQWYRLIKNLMEHIVTRYGEGNVGRWLFSSWISPDCIDMGICSEKEYEEIYVSSYMAVKRTSKNFLITGPGSTNPERYLKKFLEMCRRRDCLPDVITFRSFASGIEQEKDALNLIGNNESFSLAVSSDENLIQHTAGEIRKILKEEGLSGLPVILEEWSNNVWQRDLCNDTCYKSAYLFKNILENNHNLNGMGYFTLNDRIDEVPPAAYMFHGGFGLFTKNDIPKSACRAMELLGQMGDRLIQKGEGYFITRTDEEIQIFLYKYSHYDLLYRYRHVINLNKTNRYGVFVSEESQAFYIRFENMKSGTYEIRRYGITRDGGSSYDMWVKMGAPEPPDREEEEMLRKLSVPLYQRETAAVKNEGVLSLKASLNPQDVWLIKIKKI